MVEPVGEAVRDQIAVLFAQGASPFEIRSATGVNRHVVFRQMQRLRSPLRFSLTDREEISRGQGELTEDQIQEILRRAPIGPRLHTGPASSDPVDMYLWEVGKYPTMSSTEEQRTLALAAEGDVSAEKHLCEALFVLTAEIAMQARPVDGTP